MTLLDFFFSRNNKQTANIAKERLRIIVAERRIVNNEPYYFPELKKDIIEVICKYIHINPDMLSVQLEKKDGEIAIFELNITLLEK